MSLISSYDSPHIYESNPDNLLTPTLTPEGILVSHEFPNSANQNLDLPWSADVHNVGTDGQIAFGIVNMEGNPGNLIVTFQDSETTIAPGVYFRVYTQSPVPNCTHLIESGLVRFPIFGNYVIKLWGMWFDETTGKWTYDSTKEITINVTVQEGWPYEWNKNIFNTDLKPGAFLEAYKEEKITITDSNLIVGARVGYIITHISAVLPGYDAKIIWNGVEKVNGRPTEGPLSGSFELSPFEIGAINTMKIYMKQGPAGYNVCNFNVTITIGFSDPPSVDPNVPFNWEEIIEKYGKWIALGTVGIIVLYMMRKPSVPIIVMPGGKK
jgi:hypothetical protein